MYYITKFFSFRPPPLAPYHHLFGGDPSAAAVAAAASSRPFLLAASLYGVSGIPHGHLPPSPNSSASPGIGGAPGQGSFSVLPSYSGNESIPSIPNPLDQRRNSTNGISSGSTPLDLSHLAASVGSSAAAAAGVRAAAAAAAAVHPFLQLHRGGPGNKFGSLNSILRARFLIELVFMLGVFPSSPIGQSQQNPSNANSNSLKEGFRGLLSTDVKIPSSTK